ncbi:MAG: hypothetical protein LBD57_00120 [Endomicrobium sp.]|jgi:hypothetical protein|uniref:hypothetical protein n=1 Tax=Candidatus Endomicrobiellum cubanum TaxID=3242325 RepID=UPI002817328E|nr:hypothetical protein [Endomicrobium sp.]
MNEELLKKVVAEIEHKYDIEESNVKSHNKNLKPSQSELNEKLRSNLLAYNFNCFMDDFN